MAVRLERHLLTLASALLLESVPDTAFSATSIFSPGNSGMAARVYESSYESGALILTIDVDFATVNNAVPGSASVSAAGSEITLPASFGTTSGTVTSGLDQYVFSLHWTGAAELTVPQQWGIPIGMTYSQLCFSALFEGGCQRLVFEATSPTPITISAKGTAISSGNAAGGSSEFGLYECSSPSSCDATVVGHVAEDSVDATGAGSNGFTQRFSTILAPGFYELYFTGFSIAGESGGASVDASASLDIVMTLSPVSDCSDGLDNDGDTLVDLDDANCEDGTTASEAPPVPALGTAGRAITLTALLLFTVIRLRTRRLA